MCLDLEKNAKIKTASNDIVVYKRVRIFNTNVINNELISDGDEFTGVIKGVKCSGKINKVKLENEPNYWIYFCTDIFDGSDSHSNNSFDYLYTWVFDNEVTSVIVNGIELVKNNMTYLTPYRDFPVEICKTYTSDLVKDDDEVHIGLHSFDKLEDAISDGYGVYVKCIIPEGSEYYKGKFGGKISYSSNKLTYLEIVDVNETIEVE